MGFLRFPLILWDAYGAPLGSPSGRQSSAMKSNWNFQRGGGGGLRKNPFRGEVWIFSGITHYIFRVIQSLALRAACLQWQRFFLLALHQPILTNKLAENYFLTCIMTSSTHWPFYSSTMALKIGLSCTYLYTVPLKSKLTLETRTSRLDPRASMLETIESQVSSLEDQETRLSRICKNSKGFRGNDLFLEGRTIQYC